MPKVVVGWKFWLLWVLACIGGGFGCFVLSLLLLKRNSNSVVAIPSLIIIGVVWGIVQYLILRNHTPKINSTWILISAASIVVVPFLARYALEILDKNLAWAASAAVGAIFPYLVLRQHFLRASSWILANGASVAISIAVGEVVFGVLSRAIESQSPPRGSGGGFSALAEGLMVLFYSSLVTGVVSLAIYGAITGGTLVWLLRHPRRK